MHCRRVIVLGAFVSCAASTAFAATPSRDGTDTRPATLPTFPAPSPTTREADLGARVLESVDLNHVPLRDAIERLRAQAGVNLFVSWNIVSHAGVNPETPVDAKLSNVPLGRVLDLILSDAAGGDGKLAWAFEEGVIRISTAADIERSAMLRRERREWADELRAQARLDEQIPSLHLDRMPLWQAIDTVSQRGGVKISVPWQTLQEVGVGRSAPVSVDLDHPTTRAALTAVLEAAGERGVPLGFMLRGDTVEVATRAALKRTTDTRVYDVSDLTSAGSFHGPDDVAKWLRETVDPESWRDSRGGIGNVRVLEGRYAGLIAVTQTDDNQREIVRVLNSLRDLRPPAERKAEAATKEAAGTHKERDTGR